ncbi:IS200/IS605 family element transposase accessory protein TnpB [Candidatus Micrarchaeota archaeon]|nr:IS200/IS605 family element transposase accessory protein TnpB [Candidatus Micrarchaeota archaeon]
MMAQATIRLKVPHSTELLETMLEFSRATQFAYDYARANRISSWKTLHEKTYRKIRGFSMLPSQLCCKAIKLALETKRGCRNRKVDFRRELSIQYDHRSYSFDFSGRCSLATINGRLRLDLRVPEYYAKTYGDWEVRGAALCRSGKDLFLNVIVAKDLPAPAIGASSRTIGIDLGINNLAATSDGRFFKGVNNHIARLQGLRSRLQSKGTKSAKRHLKNLSGRQKRFMRSINHEVSRRIVSRINSGDMIVMENLHGIRSRRRGKVLNRLLSGWSFFQLRQLIEYKALRKGAIFVTVPAHYSSRECSRCHESRTERPGNAGFFHCLNCGYSCNADLNASFNLRDRADAARNVLGLFVNQPIVGDSISYSGKPTASAVGS